MATTVGQRKRTKGWRKPEGAVCVSRPSSWGNWWTVVEDPKGGWWLFGDNWAGDAGDGGTWFKDKRPALSAAAERFRADLLGEGPRGTHPRARWILLHVHELRGKTLLCWCDPTGPCHAHVLAALADAT